MADSHERGWCSVCGAWRRMIWGSQIGGRCVNCGSGRIRPPQPGERMPTTVTKAPGDDLDGDAP